MFGLKGANMTINRRALLRGLGPALAFPYLLRSQPAKAAVISIETVGNPIELGANQPGGKSSVALAAFSKKGNYAAGWINFRSFSDVRAYVQKRSRNGAALSPAIQMGGGTLTDGVNASNLAIVALPDDSSLVFFCAQRNGANSTDAFDIFVQRMDASFQKVGAPLAVNTTRVGAQTSVMATLLKNGNVQVVWESAAADFSSSTVRGRVMKPNGQPAQPEQKVIRQATGFSTPRSLVPGPNGQSVLTYTRLYNSSTAPTKATFFVCDKDRQAVGANGMPAGPVFILDRTDGSETFGAPGGQWNSPFDPSSNIFGFVPPVSGNVAELHRYGFAGGVPPQDDVIGSFRVNDFFQGPTLGADIIYNGVKHSLVGFPTETAAGANTFTVIAVRPNGAIADRLTLPFEPDFLNPCSGVVLLPPGDDPEYVFGIAAGNTSTDDKATLHRLRAFGDDD
jgi:hypothetical protein